MMAGILLLFVLIMCVTLFQSQINYEKSIKEQQEKLVLQDEYTKQIMEQQGVVEDQQNQLSDQQDQLASQDELLAAQKQQLDDLAAQLAEQQKKLDAQSVTLADQQSDLDEKTTQLAAQQKRIDNIIGVKADVIEALKKELENVEELRFIFTSPTFIKDKAKKEKLFKATTCLKNHKQRYYF